MQKYIRYCCLIVLAISVIVLIAWPLDLQFVTQVNEHFPAMSPLTATGFFFSSIWVLLFQKDRYRYKFPLFLFAVVVLLLGFLRLLDLTVPADPWLSIGDKSGLRHADVSPPSALNFCFLGVTMIFSLLLYPTHKNVVLLTTPFILFSCLLSLFGYLLGENDIFTLKPYPPMALHTTVCFLLLAIAFLFLFSRNGFIHTITRPEVGGYSARILIPYIILIPFILGLLNYYAQKRDLYDFDFGVSILVVSMVFIFLFIVWRKSKALNALDEEKNIVHAKLEMTNRKLVQANAELEQFIFIASHDLKEPLRKIMTFGDLLQRTLSKHSQHENDLAGKMVKSSKRMDSLVTDILAYTRLMHQGIQFEDVDLNDLLADVIADFEIAIVEKSASITVNKLPRIKGVRFQLTRLFSNLLSNALKFSRKEVPPNILINGYDIERAEVRTYGLDDHREYYCITFTDNGIGFDQQYASQVFEMLQRLHVGQFEGSGIGLAICKKVAQNHHGDIFVESKQGKGTTFFILLPKRLTD